jgi:phosphoenolpyruvate synthase/pyruvate phosphate dikinase
MKLVFSFGEGKAEGDPTRRDVLGGKGAGLAEMTSLGLPVPPGFTISTDACRSYTHDGKVPEELAPQVEESLARLEKQLSMRFGDPKMPLLVSVRSGARASMPGMMDTILNLGLNDETMRGLAELTGNKRFALDAYRRFIAMYADVALGVSREHFETALDESRGRVGKDQGIDATRLNAEELRRKVTDADIPEAELEKVVERFKAIVKDKTGHDFPSDPKAQLWGAIRAVFDSWSNHRAVVYRKMHDIPESWGTACNVQAMVFGNLGDTSATGVAFTRDPSTGERVLYGEWLPNAQGEDVVAGIRTPMPLLAASSAPDDALEKRMPQAFATLVDIGNKLEKHFRDIQDLEFTIQDGKLYMLQCRSAKRTGKAAVRAAVEMRKEGLITKEEALLRVDASSLDQLLHPTLDPSAPKKLLARGLSASPGAAQGKIVFSADEAERRAGQGEAVILVRVETSPEDIHGMKAARGILTARGGMTCVAGETRVLTDTGLLTAEETFGRLEDGAAVRILSFDARTMRPVWRNIIAAGKKPAEAITVSVSQTGRVDENVLRMTSDHKMFTIDQRRLVKRPLGELLESEGFVTVVTDLPALAATATSAALAYVAGAILSDGYVMLKPTKGSVTFVQKPTPEKAEFIAAVEQCFERAFGVPFSYVRERETVAVLRGREIRGSVEDRICFRRDPAARLKAIQDDLASWVLTLDRTALLHFLAGYVDGDGSYAEESSAVRLQIIVSAAKPGNLAGVALACLRLGIVPQITMNRDDYNLQITEHVDEIVAFTNRVRPEIPARGYASRCLAVRGLFTDIVDDVNFMGRVREGLKRNIMYGADKIVRDILPLCPPHARRDLEAILDAPLRSYRVKQVAPAEPTTVYNFEVDATDEIDKCFVVFSSRLTPVLVSNSHAAVVARGMGKPCVAGCSALSISYGEQTVTITQYDDDGRSSEAKQITLKKGDMITLDGGAGHVYQGALPTVNAALTGEFAELMTWADEVRTMKVRANADTPLDARTARAFGAEGIGLCRTEHMFFEEERIRAVREMILADEPDAREKALAKLLPEQKRDFVEIFREMKGLPVTIRLLDPPLHEFLPQEKKQIEELSKLLNVSVARLEQRIKDLHEFNPMLGHRGCRLAITYPEIYAMQVRAILEAAADVTAEGSNVLPEIMIPLAMTREELVRMRGIVDKVAAEVFASRAKVPFAFGTMIELPRAAVRANELAEVAEFFSFGTNDLTQCTMGLSRDDAGKFLPAYVESGILAKDPFVTIDVDGVGALVKLAVERGRATKKNIKLGVCGEHGGDPDSIRFFREAHLDYVSCSPFRVTIARLASAQAEVLSRKGRPSQSGTA